MSTRDGLTHNPDLYADDGWYIGVTLKHRSDEEVSKRVASDATLLTKLSQHADQTAVIVGPSGDIEPHLLAVQYYKIATAKLEACDMQCHNGSPVVLMAQPANAYVRYATSLHHRGHFGEHTQWAWAQAINAWQSYGDVRLPTSTGARVRLNDFDAFEDRRDKLRTEMGKVIAISSVASSAQSQELENAILNLSADKQKLAQKLLQDWKDVSYSANFVSRCQTIMNYSAKIARCKLERHPDVVAARKSLWRAKDSSLSRKERERLYLGAFKQLGQLIDANSAVIEEPSFCDELLAEIKKYQRHILDGNELPKNFPLKDIVETSRVP